MTISRALWLLNGFFCSLWIFSRYYFVVNMYLCTTFPKLIPNWWYLQEHVGGMGLNETWLITRSPIISYCGAANVADGPRVWGRESQTSGNAFKAHISTPLRRFATYQHNSLQGHKVIVEGRRRTIVCFGPGPSLYVCPVASFLMFPSSNWAFVINGHDFAREKLRGNFLKLSCCYCSCLNVPKVC